MLSLKRIYPNIARIKHIWTNYERTYDIYGSRFTSKNSNFILEADKLKRSFEDILSETVFLSNGVISQNVLDSNEIVTSLTFNSEMITENNTGICIDKEITMAELQLISDPNFVFTSTLERQVDNLNERTINLVIEVIKLKKRY